MSVPNPATTDWVALWDLNGGVKLDYKGSWGGFSLLPNSGFETDISGWEVLGSATFAHETSICKFGSKSLRVVTTAANSGASSLPTTLAPNSLYTFSCWIYSVSGDTFGMQLSDYQDLGLSATAKVVPAGVWTQFVGSGTTDAHTGWRLIVSAQTAGTFYIDGVQVEKGDTPPFAGSYTDGDVVVHQGTTYMCVRPTSAAPVPWPLASGSASYGTSPPANPVDGQIWMLPVADGVVWQFRYNAASASAYKWEFVGGSALMAIETSPVGLSGTAFSGALCAPAIPRAGVYQFRHWHAIQVDGVANLTFGWRVAPTTGISGAFDVDTYYGGAAGYRWTYSMEQPLTITAAAVSVGVAVKLSGGNATSQQRMTSALPVRVS